MEPVTILFAFLSGLLFRRLGYPPLPGYLLAGFVSHALGFGDIDFISQIADIGITLLLFTIGLKLNVKVLAMPQVWGVASLQILVVVPLTAGVILLSAAIFPAFSFQDNSAAWVLAFALSFSSTVFAIKMFEDRGETISIHAKLAIGVLVIQDLLAVAFLVFTSESPPGLSALWVFMLPLLRPIGLYLLRHAGHGELVLLFGITIALGVAEWFERLHLEAGLGALLAGVLLGHSARSKELYDSLMGLKDIFLIGFFLQIGYYGLPSAEMILVAAILGLLIFIRPLVYFLLFTLFRLRARTSLFASLSLFNYSEFGLIVAAIAMQQGILPSEWLTTLALALSISFFIATPLNTNAHRIYNRFHVLLHKLERSMRLETELPANLGDASIVVLGMGRVGVGAYKYFNEIYPGSVVGVEENSSKVIELVAAGINCVHADASDHDFWEQTDMQHRSIALVSLSNHSENMTVVRLSKQFGFKNSLAVVSRYPDEQSELEREGCIAFNLYAEAGFGFAEHVEKHLLLKS